MKHEALVDERFSLGTSGIIVFLTSDTNTMSPGWSGSVGVLGWKGEVIWCEEKLEFS